ncbi:hypothetical protein [Streptomyces sp. NPDC004546]|uniref:hypothetical protein n=1 Tax=unclassified Streptomyces TaxID=2593676 RepID=UPI0033BD7551
MTEILERGQRAGVSHEHLPTAVLSAALEALTLSLLESVNTGTWEDDPTRTAVAAQVAAVEGVVAQMRAETTEG